VCGLERLGLAFQTGLEARLLLSAAEAVVDGGHRHQREPTRAVAEKLQRGGRGRGTLGRPVDPDEHVDWAAARVTTGQQPRPGRTPVPDRRQRQQQRDRPQHQAKEPPR
jgi:hypothetical protein